MVDSRVEDHYPWVEGHPACTFAVTSSFSLLENTLLTHRSFNSQVAADIVEVAPAYDTNAELTTMAAADTLYEVMSLMVLNGPLSEMGAPKIEAKEDI